MDLETLKSLTVEAGTKIVLLVLDGLGGLPMEPGGPTELEAAQTPNLDALAARGVTGLVDPVGPGITPGSGPGHLALFGYDPLKYQIGRGVLEALGIDLELTPRDVAARGNFCSMDDEEGKITDRRAGRISTEHCVELSKALDAIQVGGVQVIVRPVKEHRFVVLFRGEGLSDQLTESDPQREGEAPLKVEAKEPEAEWTAGLVNTFIDKARSLLKEKHPADMILLRGFAKHPNLPAFPELYQFRAAAIAVYPIYRGLGKLAGMEALATGPTVREEFEVLRHHWRDFDFFYLHVKGTDSAGEDGNFQAKVAVIEEVDREILKLLALRPDVLVVTGDHATPAALKAHSWHPVPLLLSSRWCRPDGVQEFSERGCLRGGLGRLRGKEVLPLALAHALRLAKFGA
ncbi:MAG: 2,3-bisphosphoglycerate-independent phosphoglycerate mutase [Candidatus Methylomirabilales bacterium]